MLDSMSFHSTSHWPWPFFVLLALVAGPPLGFLKVYLGGGLAAITGRWLGGGATAEECRAAIGWSALPQIAALALWVPALAILGDEAFFKGTQVLTDSVALFATFVAVVVVWSALQLWSAVLRWKCLGEAHGFSAWRAFGADAIVVVVLVVLVVGAVLLFVPDPVPIGGPGSAGTDVGRERILALGAIDRLGHPLELDGDPATLCPAISPGGSPANPRG
jgi:hypothetical protein